MIDKTYFGRQRISPLLMLLAILLTGCAQPPSGDRSDADVGASGPPPLQTENLALVSGGTVDLQPNAPTSYTVQPGDTLWDIAGRFLNSPWRWREIWRQNPDIRNPNLIFPGDVIELYYEAGEPRLRLAKGQRATVRLSPKVRVGSLERPIPTLPRETIAAFIEQSQVLIEADWAGSPYVVGAVEDRIKLSPGDRIFARGGDFDRPIYQVFRPGEEYRDPDTNESLGFDVIYLGDAVLEKDDDPASLRLTRVKRGIELGDRLFPADEEEIVYQFLPFPADEDVEGSIIASLSGGFLVGRYQTVVVNVGDIDGAEPGMVMAIYTAGRLVNDPIAGGKVLLPEDRSGLLMIYKVFDRVSYGLIMEATRTIRIFDRVGTP